MGFFSKLCSVSHIPVMAPVVGLIEEEASTIVAVFKDGGGIVAGVYDGYGRVNDYDLVDDWDNVKFVLSKYYKGQTYDELGKSHDDPGQGFFYDDDTIVAWHKRGGFDSFSEFWSAWKELNNRARGNVESDV